MTFEAVRRAALRLDASYTENLVRLERARSGAPHSVPVIAVPESDTAPTGRFAVIAHVFYPELLGQLRSGLNSLPPRTDVFVSVPSDSVRLRVIEALEQLDLGILDVRIVENRGRDIAPKYVTFADVYGRDYDLLLFLHTKKSLTADFGDSWRDQLFRSLIGSPQVVNGIISMFESDARLGVVAPRHHELIGSTTGWDGNYREAKRLARRAGIMIHRWAPPDFASGSMFWARPQALAGLTGLGLRIDDFPAENGQVGVTIMHALERMVFIAAAEAGFASVMVADSDTRRRDVAVEGSSLPIASRRPPAHLFAIAALFTVARFGKSTARRLTTVVHRGARGDRTPFSR